MPSFNRVTLMGNLTRDPELRYFPSGTPLAVFGLAVNSFYKGKDGERKETTVFVEIQAQAKTAELVAEYLKKGRLCFVEGRLKYHSWEDDAGVKHNRLTVAADRVLFLDRRTEKEKQAQENPPTTEPPQDLPKDDDCPF